MSGISLDAVVAIVSTLAGRPATPDDRLIADLGLDSLDLYELALALDDLEPGVQLPDHVPVHLLTVRDAAALARADP